MIYFGEPTQQRRVTIGLDLGHANDHSALAILEQGQHHRVLRQATRIPLRTPFAEIVTCLDRIVRSPDLAGRATIVADATGLGAPVIEMLRAARIQAALIPVVITGEVNASQSNGSWHVPKKDLVTALCLMFESGNIRIPKGLPGLRRSRGGTPPLWRAAQRYPRRHRNGSRLGRLAHQAQDQGRRAKRWPIGLISMGQGTCPKRQSQSNQRHRVRSERNVFVPLCPNTIFEITNETLTELGGTAVR